uniref:TSA: Wollemia nobilis Ref_Wollemi_Transcript_15840_3487 transcribed RNA sequence n=1 Tax=Wollemia nobilis TaxID=56998 RepID=A0A0C9RIM1_9CONI
MALAIVSVSSHSPLSHERKQNYCRPAAAMGKGRKEGSIGSRFASMGTSFKGVGLTGGDTKFKQGVRRRSVSLVVFAAVFERFTERAIKSVMFAQREAKALGQQEVGTQHLLLGLIAEERRGAGGFLGSGIGIDRAREAARALNGMKTKGAKAGVSAKNATDIPFSVGSKRVFEAAMEHSRKMGHNYIAPEHIAIALFNVDDGGATSLLQRLGVKKEDLAAVAASKLQGELAKEGREPFSSLALPAKSTSRAITTLRHAEKKKEKGALVDFCVDITARASDGRIDPVIGREKEVERVVQILGRRTKNNPILLGEPGVGKTAIAEGLALRIIQGTVPEFLHGKRMLSLDIGLLMAGAKERGELEMRVTSLINEIQRAGNVILLIDEVHTLVGSGTVGRGSNSSGLDIANLFKPALARGQLQCIGATTLDEHTKHIEKDKALARRFQPVLVHEPTKDDAAKILMGLLEKYEDHHKCRFTIEAVDAAVQLSAKYIQDRYLPDKAIDLIDEAGSHARIKACNRRKERQANILLKSPSEYWSEIREVQKFYETAPSTRTNRYHPKQAGRSVDVFAPTTLGNDVEVVPLPSISSTSNEDEYDNGPVVVGPEDIAAIASLWSGIPVEQLTVDEQLKLIGLEKQLQTRVVGQDDAVNAIARALRRARVGLKDPGRPIAAMLFCGPTGVGKTELTKALAECYFGSENAMIRLDMSEYMERHTVSKLIGSPPGYVGYGKGGILTEAVRRRPFTVILLDEIEKAHHDVFNILLQVFEEGHLADSQGRRVSFKNTVIIMTSNIGSTAISRGGRRLGFDFGEEIEDRHLSLKALVMGELKGYFRPELLNRIDEVVVFRSLEKYQLREILGLMLKDTRKRLSSLGIGLEVSEAVFNLICEQGYDQSYGARPLKRAVTRLVEDVVSEALLADNYQEDDTVLVDLDASGNPFVTHHRKPDRCDHGICLPIITSTL